MTSEKMGARYIAYAERHVALLQITIANIYLQRQTKLRHNYYKKKEIKFVCVLWKLLLP